MSDSKNYSMPDDRDTRPFSSDAEPREAPHRQPHILDDRIPRALQFSTMDKAYTFTVDVTSAMVVGRRNSMTDLEVVVDLADFDAYQMGVSRHHAIILTLDNRVTIKDLDSLNGTRLNNLDLEPSQEYLLEHGDKVSFGKLNFLISFVY